MIGVYKPLHSKVETGDRTDETIEPVKQCIIMNYAVFILNKSKHMSLCIANPPPLIDFTLLTPYKPAEKRPRAKRE